MFVDVDKYNEIQIDLKDKSVVLVAVSKTKPAAAIEELYALGHKDFGENYVQELVEKQDVLPKDIRWHFIGHLQSNKVKTILPFVHLIHGVDSLKLLKEINKQSQKINRTTDVLLQVHISQEETKFGFDEAEIEDVVHALNKNELSFIQVKGLMGMASFTDNKEQVRKEFKYLKSLFDNLAQNKIGNYLPEILSMGMSGDYDIALEEGSNMIRIGSLIFGKRPAAPHV